jgi:hypothetical protein
LSTRSRNFFHKAIEEEDNSENSLETTTEQTSLENCGEVPCKFLKTSMEMLAKKAKLMKKAAILRNLIEGSAPIIGSPTGKKDVINNIINFDIIFKSRKYNVVSD